MPVKMGVKKGGCYAGGVVPDPRFISGASTIGVNGYNKMLYNMQNGIDPTKPQTAAPNALTAGIAQPAAPVAAAAAAAPVAAPATPTPAAPSAPAKPAGLSISNGMDSGGGLQITNGFDSTPAPLANTQPAQTTTRLSSAQGYARGKVPSLTDGIIRGPGGPTEDKVDAKVSPQEAILPARTVQAIGGPAAVKALIERTNGGMPPESEVVQGGKFANGLAGAFDMSYDDVRNRRAPVVPVQPDPTPEATPAPQRIAQVQRQPSAAPVRQEPGNIYAQSNEELAGLFKRQNMPRVDMLGGAEMQRPGLSQPTAKPTQFPAQAAPAARVPNGSGDGPGIGSYINNGDPVKDVVRGVGNAMMGVGDFFSKSAQAARQPDTWDSSGTHLQHPDAPAARPAVAPLAAAAVPAAPDYSNEPNAPANTPAPLSAAARPATAQAIARLPSPGADTQVGSYGMPAQIQQPSGYQQAPEQAKPERLATNGTSWEADEAARRRSFDNFVTRSDLQSGVRDAQRSGRRGEAAAAANALTSFNNQADAHEEKAGEFDRGMKALDAKTAKDQEMEGVKSKNALAQVSLQGQNNLSITGMQGQNALATEALRGRNDLASRQYVNPLDAEGKRLSNQQAMAKLATEGTLQTLQSRMLSATDDNERQDIQDQIMALQGREPRNRFTTNVVHGVRTKNIDGSETASSPMAYTTDARTGQVTTRGIGEQDAPAKTFTMEQVQQTAKNRGMAPDAVVKALQAAGLKMAK